MYHKLTLFLISIIFMKENNHQHGKDKKYKPITLVPIQMRAEKKKSERLLN